MIVMTTITILSAMEIINYGLGLGDLGMTAGIAICSLISLVSNLYYTAQRKKARRHQLLPRLSLIYTLVILYYCYSFTVGRGMEFPWNGNIFK